MPLLTVNKIDVRSKHVFLRVDFNVPLYEGHILDTSRIEASLETIHYLIKQKAKIIIASHLGRPKEKDPSLSLHPIALKLEQLLKHPVKFVHDCIGTAVEQAVASLKEGDVLVLENLRFYPAETKPKLDPSFAKNLASLADVYINDAFGASHRAHSSITGIPHYIQAKAMGFLLQKECLALDKLLHPQHPFCTLIGGAKVSSKLEILKALIDKVDFLLIGGAMAFTFLKVQNIPIGHSFFEAEMIDEASLILQKGKGKIILSCDFVIQNKKIVSSLNNEDQGCDIGPKTIQLFTQTLKESKTIFWNGPMGIYEKPPFDEGTVALAKACSQLNAYTVVGGGDSLAAIHEHHLEKGFSHLSTGGGATLEFLEKGDLPGLEALKVI